jgi:hypothetical protein
MSKQKAAEQNHNMDQPIKSGEYVQRCIWFLQNKPFGSINGSTTSLLSIERRTENEAEKQSFV